MNRATIASLKQINFQSTKSPLIIKLPPTVIYHHLLEVYSCEYDIYQYQLGVCLNIHDFFTKNHLFEHCVDHLKKQFSAQERRFSEHLLARLVFFDLQKMEFNKKHQWCSLPNLTSTTLKIPNQTLIFPTNCLWKYIPVTIHQRNPQISVSEKLWFCVLFSQNSMVVMALFQGPTTTTAPLQQLALTGCWKTAPLHGCGEPRTIWVRDL